MAARQENGTGGRTETERYDLSESCVFVPRSRVNGVSSAAIAEFYGSETPYGRMGWWVGKEVEKGRKSRHVRDTWHGRKEEK